MGDCTAITAEILETPGPTRTRWEASEQTRSMVSSDSCKGPEQFDCVAIAATADATPTRRCRPDFAQEASNGLAGVVDWQSVPKAGYHPGAEVQRLAEPQRVGSYGPKGQQNPIACDTDFDYWGARANIIAEITEAREAIESLSIYQRHGKSHSVRRAVRT